MYKLKKKIGNLFTSKFVGTGPSSYKKEFWAVVSQSLRNTPLTTTLLQAPTVITTTISRKK